jgi:hypothetical protein
MKRFPFLTVLALAGMLLSACGAPAAPTMNPIDVQSTAQAAAMTMVAQTLAAVPTATPLPPTEPPTQTPAATDTPLALPTLAVTLTSTPAAASNNGGGDPCANRVLSYSPKGKATIIRIANTTKVTVNVSLYLNETEGHGECGYRAYTLTKNNDVVITDLVYGCYSVWAWSDDAKDKFGASGGGCINNPDKWTFEISSGKVKFTQ